MLIRGVAKWAKVVGEPAPGYGNKFREWSVDVYVDEPTIKRLTAEGIADKIKDKGNGPYLSFKRKELKSDGTPNNPIRVVDNQGQPWGDKRIGNGSIVNVNFAINPYGQGQTSLNILSMQVWDHVEYGDNFPIKTDNDDEGNWEQDAA